MARQMKSFCYDAGGVMRKSGLSHDGGDALIRLASVQLGTSSGR